MIEHRHASINGWFNFQDLYLKMVNDFTEGHFVEIGTFCGKSASFMGVEIANSGKNIKFDSIDTFEGSPDEMEKAQKIFLYKDIYQIAKDNVKGLPVNIIKGDSLKVVKTYKNKSLDFVFIDGCHTYDCVVKDIKAWKPKVKKGGYIGGHDYSDNRNVFKAVNDTLKKNCPYSVTSWLIQL